MELIDKIFFINLDERCDRKEHFYDQCKLHNIPQDKVERFPAINGKTYLFTKDELQMFKNASYNTSMLIPLIVSKKIMGNQLSHYNILLEMKKRNYNNIIIFQDDAILKNKFTYYVDEIMQDIPHDAEIINIGLHKKAVNEDFEPYNLDNDFVDNDIVDKQITNFVCSYKIWNSVTRYRVNPASLAYIVTKKGCDNLLEHFYKNGFNYETDWNYNLYLQEKNIFYGSKYVLVTGNSCFKSDIFIDTDNYMLEDLLNTNIYYTHKNTIHSYFGLYNELFNPIRKQSKNIFEIGIGNFNKKNGGSLLLWRMFFKNALIHGADIISENRVYDIVLKNSHIKTYLNSDAYTSDFVEKFKNQNLLFDVILDDGPHTLESQCKCIELYSDLLTENGILVIEDVQDMNWISKFKELTPPHLQKYIHVYDLRHIKNRYDDIVFVINKNISNVNQKYGDITKPLVISYENNLKKNQNAQMFKKTLDKYKWDYEFIGEGVSWKGFDDKLIGYYNFLTNKSLPDDKIVLLSDSRDVFCLRSPELFIKNVKQLDNKIIISTELFLIGHMNWTDKQISDSISKNPTFFCQGVPLNDYWKFHGKQENIPHRKYLNSGLIVGKVSMLKNALKWIIENKYNDDQLGFCKYTIQFPELVHLDHEATILHTTTAFVQGSFYNHEVQCKDMPSFSELSGLSSYFLHIPGINYSKGQKYIYSVIYNLFNNNSIETMFDLYNLPPSYPLIEYWVTDKRIN